jgi:hypothetical protein
MKFWRDAYQDAACLEYSWVPQGIRHTILLQPGVQEGSSTNPMPDEIEPSHVQVYTLNNNNNVSTAMWQFPPGPPHGSPVVRASVEVFEANAEAIGTVYYADGSSVSDKHKLDRKPIKCPEIPPQPGR